MKRSELKRKSELKADPGKVRAFIERGRRNLERGDSELKRGKAPARRRRPAMSAEECRLAKAWFDAIVHEGVRCVQCGSDDWRGMQAHHVIRQQHLRQLAVQLGASPARLLWDKGVGVPVCESPCHANHTGRTARIPASKLPARVWTFASDLDDWLEAAGQPRVATIWLLREHP